jgi:hypothetical protein
MAPNPRKKKTTKNHLRNQTLTMHYFMSKSPSHETISNLPQPSQSPSRKPNQIRHHLPKTIPHQHISQAFENPPRTTPKEHSDDSAMVPPKSLSTLCKQTNRSQKSPQLKRRQNPTLVASAPIPQTHEHLSECSHQNPIMVQTRHERANRLFKTASKHRCSAEDIQSPVYPKNSSSLSNPKLVADAFVSQQIQA